MQPFDAAGFKKMQHRDTMVAGGGLKMKYLMISLTGGMAVLGRQQASPG
jgi:hypothetical protein